MRTAAKNIPFELVRLTGWAVLTIALGLPVSQADTTGSGGDQCSHGGTQSFSLLPESGDLVGENRYIRALHSDSLHDIACRNNIGVEEIFMANDPAKIDHWAPGEGTRVLIPQRFILPNAPRAGVVVNIPEMRLYFYPVQYATVVKKAPAKPKPKPGAKGKAAPPPAPRPAAVTEIGEPIGKATEVITYPISMGRMDWRTPLGKTRVASKVKDPTWTPPESIRREHAAKGEILPAVVPAGPDNPLGAYAMRLGVAGYLIHGTEQNYKSFGIGMRVTHGCMRMYNEDVAKLFPRVSVGTPVYLVNQPVKLGWHRGVLYMEVHPPLDEDAGIPPEKEEEEMSQAELAREEAKTPEQRAAEAKRKNAKRFAYLEKVAANLIQKENGKRPILVDREVVRKALETPTGIPVEIGKEAPPVEAMPGEPVPGQGAVTPSLPSSAEPPRGGSGQYEPQRPESAPYRPAQSGSSPTGELDRAAPSTDSAARPYWEEQGASSGGNPGNYAPPPPAEAVPPYPADPAAENRTAGDRYDGSDPWAHSRSEPDQPVPDPYAPDQSAPVTEEPPEEDAPPNQPEGGR